MAPVGFQPNSNLWRRDFLIFGEYESDPCLRSFRIAHTVLVVLINE